MRDEKIVEHILSQVAAALDRLTKSGAPSSIDLRQVPRFGANAYEQLKCRLGSGEASASIAATDGADEVVRATETAFAGVWWITHRNGNGDIVTEMIEICPFPPLLAAHSEEIRQSAERLGRLCDQVPHVEVPLNEESNHAA